MKRIVLLGSLLACAILPASAGVDLDGDGMDDIWELVFSAESLAAGDDSDGDGQDNRGESVLGTDPFSPQSRIALSGLSLAGGNFTLQWPGVNGKLYQIRSKTSLTGATWQNEGSPINGRDAVLTGMVPASPDAQKFFQVLVTDKDSDNDGVLDWDEVQLGTDPTKTDSDHNGVDDHTQLLGALAAPSVVSAAPGILNASEEGPLPGSILVKRSGGVKPVTVRYSMSGTALAGADYQAPAGSVTIPLGAASATVVINPVADSVVESTETATLSVMADATYSVGSGSGASVVIHDPSTPSGTGLKGEYFDNASTTYSNAANFSGLKLTRTDAVIDFDWTTGSPDPSIGVDTFSIRWTGQVQPQYSETYTFIVNSNNGAKLWVNGQLIIDDWSNNGALDRIGSIALQAGVRHDIRLEYFESTSSASAKLYWYGPSQPKQIIPASRLYPSSQTATPTSIISPLSAVALVGAPFSYTVIASNGPATVGASNLPPELSFDAGTGIISGIATTAGTYSVLLSASNAAGSAANVLSLQVIDTGATVTREFWASVGGTSVADIPVTTAPSSTSTLTSLEGPAEAADNYGVRIRGYITPAKTGNHYFWLAGSGAAELWISNDDQPAGKFRRARVVNGSASQQWNTESGQKSPWLALVEGQKYYFEILQKAATGTGDNLAVGWLQPGESGTAPGGIVPGYALSPFVAAPAVDPGGTLYTTSLTAQSGAQTGGFGSATLRLNQDETEAVLAFSYSNLTTPVTGAHVHSADFNGHPSQIIFDIDDATPQMDGSYIWHIDGLGTLTAAEIVQVIKQGSAYLNIHTASYPGGEIKGFFKQQDGSQTFTPPAAAPAWTDDHGNASAASRFLSQATFGPSLAEIAGVQSLGYDGWITDQFTRAASLHLPVVYASAGYDLSNLYDEPLTFNAWWRQSVTGADQLRQRVAFALSQILVVSAKGTLDNNARALSSYYDTLLGDVFGNFRDILEKVTLSPAMGLYLDMRRNEKPDLATGRIPNENYAREIMQLFSIGLYRQHPDGSLILNTHGAPIDNYAQQEIIGLAHVFTGWNYNQPNQGNGQLPTSWSPSADYTNPMKEVPGRHFTGTKRLLNNVVLPGLTTAAGAPLAPYLSHTAAQISDPAYQALPSQELDAALDSLFEHPNTGPFICRQLIQRLVTSTPSRGYIYRVVQKFNDNGSGVRGDMKAVIKAILLDYEARSPAVVAQQGYGKQREPLLRVTSAARAFPPPAGLNGTYSQAGETITVTTSGTHRLANGNTVYLNFSTGGATSGGYSPTVRNSTQFTVNAPDIRASTYSQSGTAITVTTTNTHGLATGNRVYLDFTSGTPDSPADGEYAVTVTGTRQFTVTAADSTTRSGNNWTGFYKGGYAQSGSTISIATSANHNLAVGDFVYIDFPGTPPADATDGQFQIVSVADANHFTVTAPDSATRSANGVVLCPLAGLVLNRTGSLSTAFNTWLMNNTDSDLAQTPLSAATVFNFWTPDYQFPGSLAGAGLVTPEFQLTSEINVIRQSNFLYNGVLNPGSNTSGLSSFKNGGFAIGMDLSPWMPLTSDGSIPALVDQLNSLLMGGQLPANVKNVIVNYVTGPPTGTKNFPMSTTPTDSQRRDRVRAIVHLILTSPDFTIQK